MKLAHEMKELDVDAMLDRIGSRAFYEWKAYDAVEPFGPERGDYYNAHIVQTLWNIARPKNHPGYPLSDFLLDFGDRPAKPKQSLEAQTLLIESWIAGSNAAFEASKKCPPTSA